jgi:hypothetical protein
MVESMPYLAEGDDAGFMNKVALILRPPEKKPMPDELKKDAKKAPEKNGGARGNS